jgi:hypothetical protein
MKIFFKTTVKMFFNGYTKLDGKKFGSTKGYNYTKKKIEIF